MKLRGTLTQLGLSWLDRLLPTFEKLTTTGSQHRLITLYFNPTQMSLVVRPGEDFGSVDAHADVRISSTSTTTTNNNENNEEEEEEEIFERKSYVCTSIARDQIAFKVDANGLSRVVKGLVHVNATGARVKLLRRERRRKEENTTTNDNNNITQCNNKTSKQYVDRVNIEYMKLAARGITITVSSGDSGALITSSSQSISTPIEAR